MKRAAIALALAISACSQGDWVPPASVYRHYGDRLRVYLSPFLGQPCDASWAPKRDDPPVGSCYAFGQSQRLNGVLQVPGYGRASFYAGLSTVPNELRYWDKDWRAVSDSYRLVEPLPEKDDRFRNLKLRNYRIWFIGRTTAKFSTRGEHRVVIIDRIERIERLPDQR